MASGWNLWVWLQCIGVASQCCNKEVYIILIIIINFPYSTCIKSFFGSSILTSLFIFKCFFGLVSVIFLQRIVNVTHRTFEIVQKKSRFREYKNWLEIGYTYRAVSISYLLRLCRRRSYTLYP